MSLSRSEFFSRCERLGRQDRHGVGEAGKEVGREVGSQKDTNLYQVSGEVDSHWGTRGPEVVDLSGEEEEQALADAVWGIITSHAEVIHARSDPVPEYEMPPDYPDLDYFSSIPNIINEIVRF